jgi:hypothetical protein
VTFLFMIPHKLEWQVGTTHLVIGWNEVLANIFSRLALSPHLCNLCLPSS